MNVFNTHRHSFHFPSPIPKTTIPLFSSSFSNPIITKAQCSPKSLTILSLPSSTARYRTSVRRVVVSCSSIVFNCPESSGLNEDKMIVDDDVYKDTLRLVECAMLAAVSALTYFLSNSLAIENYFGCFFALPIVMTSMRWGVAAGRKTMVATGMLLLVLAGPVKALTYLLMHGFAGFAMGSLWRLGTNWSLSIFLTTLVRAVGACGYVLVTSFLIRENIFSLVIVLFAYIHVLFLRKSNQMDIIPSMNAIYALFGTLVLINCGLFIFLLHVLYVILLTKLGMTASFKLPKWLDKTM